MLIIVQQLNKKGFLKPIGCNELDF